MQTAQHTEEVVVATTGLPYQFDAALLRGSLERGDTVAVLEAVAGQVACLHLADSINSGITLFTTNLQRRLSTNDLQVERVVDTLARQLLRELMLLDGIVVVRQIYNLALYTILTMHIDAQLQLGTMVPDGRAIDATLGALSNGYDSIASDGPRRIKLGQQFLVGKWNGGLTLANGSNGHLGNGQTSL